MRLPTKPRALPMPLWLQGVFELGQAAVISAELRAAGLRADRAFDGRSMKSQMKAADRSGAALAVIIGDDERTAGKAVVRPLRAGGDQRTVARVDLVTALRADLDS